MRVWGCDVVVCASITKHTWDHCLEKGLNACFQII